MRDEIKRWRNDPSLLKCLECPQFLIYFLSKINELNVSVSEGGFNEILVMYGYLREKEKE